MTQAADITPFQDPVEHGLPARPVVDAAPADRARAAISADANWICPFGNSQRNSRSAFAAQAGPHKIAWKVELSPSLHPMAVLAAADRILVRWPAEWLLVDRGGKSIARGSAANGDLILDPAHGVFFLSDLSGLTIANNLSDGARRFSLMPWQPLAFYRSAIFRRNDYLLTIGIPATGKQGEPPQNEAVLELRDLSEGKIDAMGSLRGSKRAGKLYLPARRVEAALGKSRLIVTARQRLFFGDPQLRLEFALTGDFQPRLVSLDEEDWAHVIVKTSSGRELWVLDAQGQRRLRVEISPEYGRIVSPPIIGFDRRIHLIGGQILTTLDARGQIVYRVKSPGPISGAAVTANGHVVLAAGSHVMSYDSGGLPSEIFSAPGEVLAAAPALTSEGGMLVASERRLYCLTPIQSEESKPSIEQHAAGGKASSEHSATGGESMLRKVSKWFGGRDRK